MGRPTFLIVFLVVVATPASASMPVVDGAWMGSAEIGDKTLALMMNLETQADTTRGVLELPLEGESTAGMLVPEEDRLQFIPMVGAGSLRLQGMLDRRCFSGTIQRGATSGTFALHRSMTPEELAPFAGFYRSGPGAFLHIQPWDELGAQCVSLNEAGELRALFALDESTLVSGPGVMRARPVESVLSFSPNGSGGVSSVRLRRDGNTRTFERTRLYETEDLLFANGNVPLAGTLFKPAGPAPYPVMVLTHGSGDQNRFAGLLFMVPLLEKGIAVFSYDKRGVGGSGGSWMASGFEDLADDALAAVALLRTRPDIDPAQVGIWGLSQGGWIAPLAASRSPEVAFVVGVSAPAVTPETQELTRMRYEMQADSEPATDVELAQTLYKSMNRWVRTGEGWEEYIAVRRQAEGKRWGPSAEPPRQDNPYFEFWRKVLDYDPVPTLEKLTCPMLAVYGGLDPNVRPEDNAHLMEAALRTAGHEASRVVVYPSGNHVMLEARTESPREISVTSRFVPGYFDLVTAWVLEQVGRKP